jgi:hypothetical protein
LRPIAAAISATVTVASLIRSTTPHSLFDHLPEHQASGHPGTFGGPERQRREQ